MLDLLTWGTPNGHKVHIMLEECGTPYRIHPANIHDKERFLSLLSPLSVNPKIPVLVDNDTRDGQRVTVCESGAILIYLAEKYQRFLSNAPVERFASMQWLMFQMSAVGPMMGQLNHFQARAHPDDAYARERFSGEVQRLHDVMEQHLAHNDFFAGSRYSVADMAIFPWLRLSEKMGLPWPDFPKLRHWYERILARPAVQRALQLPHISTAAPA